MSSKVGQNQQQGRRTPLSLAGGKHSQQQQHQNNKNHSNLSKIQEAKSETAVTKNGSHNNASKNQETNNLTQKEIKKSAAAQHNGNGNGNNDNDDDVIIVPDNDDVAPAGHTKNGTANGHKNKKNNTAKSEKSKEKDNKETENNKDNKDKSEKNETVKQTEKKKQNEIVEQPNELQATSNSIATTNDKKSTDDAAKTSNAIVNEEKTATATAASSESNTNANTQKSATPTKAIEKGTATPPSKSPASNYSTPLKSPRGVAAAANKSSNSIKDAPADVMMPLVIEPSPSKKTAAIIPAATSTPGKIGGVPKRSGNANVKTETEIKKDNNGSPEYSSIPRVFSQIGGRRSIRPLDDFTPSMYNSQFRESYRRINTELDVTGNTNTSMNVTVGSEIPNNSSFLSFSLFGRGRKRERTPPPPTTRAKSQSAVELTTKTETTPPKRARLDVHGIFEVMSSPLTLLRTRFSKTSLESSTPAKSSKNVENINDAEDDDVQNVSGVAIEEVVANSNSADNSKEQNDITIGKEATTEAEKTPNKISSSPNKINKSADQSVHLQANESKEAAAMDVDNSDIQIKETPIIAAVGDLKIKQRGCKIM